MEATLIVTLIVVVALITLAVIRISTPAVNASVSVSPVRWQLIQN